MIGSGARRRFAYATAPMMRPPQRLSRPWCRTHTRHLPPPRSPTRPRHLLASPITPTPTPAPPPWLWSHALLRHPSPRRPASAAASAASLEGLFASTEGAADSIELLREASRLNQLTPKELLRGRRPCCSRLRRLRRLRRGLGRRDALARARLAAASLLLSRPSQPAHTTLESFWYASYLAFGPCQSVAGWCAGGHRCARGGALSSAVASLCSAGAGGGDGN